MIKGITRSTLSAVALVALAACSSGEAGQAADHGGKRTTIHLDQTAVMTIDGVPAEEKGYRAALAGCRQSGIATHELTPYEVGKLGRTHLELWVSPDHQARHTETWKEDIAGTCQFKLVHVDQTQIDDAAGKSTLIDNVAHTGDVQDFGAQAPVEALGDDDGQMDDAARQSGWVRVGEASANGQPCTIWRDRTNAELCIWNAGHAWGYTANGVNALHDGLSQGAAIVLWNHPGHGAAYKLDTHTFTVGEPVDDSAFRIPGNVAINKSSN